MGQLILLSFRVLYQNNMNQSQKQYQAFSFEIKQIDNEDPKFFILEGHASTFGNLDLGNDVVQRGAFRESLKQNPSVPILSQHDMSEKIGDTIELFEDDIGLFVKIILPKDDDEVRGRIMPQIRSSMKAGRPQEMSIGFFIKEFSFDVETDVRTLEKVDLFEISLVSKAMNPKARVTDFKSFKDVQINNIKDIEIFLKGSGLSQNEAKTLISKIKEFSKQRDVVTDEGKEKQCDVANAKMDQLLNFHTDHKVQQIINNLNINKNV